MSRLRTSLATVLDEILHGSGAESSLLLNRHDPGLLDSLDRLTAAQASERPTPDAASVAAHVDHLRYGLELLNRWARGEDPFEEADWSASWQRTQVTDDEWAARRAALRHEAETWRAGMGAFAETGEAELTGVIAEIAHLAYHLGALRQIERGARGPSAEDNRAARGLA